MNQPRDPDALIAMWLEDGPIDLPDETRRAISVGLRTQPRVRRMAVLGGSSMSPINRLAAAAAIVLAVGAFSAFVLSNRTGSPGTSPAPSISASSSGASSPSASPAIAPSPSSTVSTAGWVTFTSNRYGYRIAHPPTWTATPATRAWVYGPDRLKQTTLAADQFIDGAATYQILVTAFAVDVATGTSEDAWITAYYQTDPDPSCAVKVAALVPMTVGGQPGRIGTSTCSDSQAFVFLGNRVHVFAVWRPNQAALLEAFLSTVQFTSDAVGPSPDASPSPG
jgi:hypothetical protein